MSKCGYPLLIDIINRKFSVNFKISARDKFDIFKSDDGWQLLEFLNNPIPFCRYCTNEIIDFEWEAQRVRAEITDYIV